MGLKKKFKFLTTILEVINHDFFQLVYTRIESEVLVSFNKQNNVLVIAVIKKGESYN